jgi:hypothetical protein
MYIKFIKYVKVITSICNCVMSSIVSITTLEVQP